MNQSATKMKAIKKVEQSRTSLKGKRAFRLSPKQLKDAVVTIGFRAHGVTAAQNLKGELKAHLGGKGFGLLAIAKAKIPVPYAINLSTSLCAVYLQNEKLPELVWSLTKKAIVGMEKASGKTFGAAKDPLLLSVRSGARVSMPGMMDTILNLGLTTEITKQLASAQPDRARFWWDCYRRLIHMFGSVVLNVEDSYFEDLIREARDQENVETDAELTAGQLETLCQKYLRVIEEHEAEFPQDPETQLKLATEAVFRSWNTERALHYRKMHQYPDHWGTSVTLQMMVFGNRNDQSGTGVVFTRNPSTGEKSMFGEYLLNAQGEDVVAGIRTPAPMSDLKERLPKVFKDLERALQKLESEFADVQDVEFTFEDGRLFVLQTRTAKRTAAAAVHHAIQFVNEKKIKPAEAIARLTPEQIRQLLHPTLKPTSEKPIGKGLPASPGAVSGRAAFNPERAVELARSGPVILVRRETSPEDIIGMSVSEGILTSTGGMTSHAAVVGRGMGKACVVGCSQLDVNEKDSVARVGSTTIREGDFLTLNGSTGEVYLGNLPTEPVSWGPHVQKFFSWADTISKQTVLANADTPEQAALSRSLGASGIGLCRTEHMFFEQERIRKFRLMILSDQASQMQKFAEELLPYQRADFLGIFRAMKNLSVCVRLLDPPLHEFLPSEADEEALEDLAGALNKSVSQVKARLRELHEQNPMLGHRGCRLGVTFPEIYSIQIQALALALCDLLREGLKVELKIMIPLAMSAKELQSLLNDLKYLYGDQIWKELSDQAALGKQAFKLTKWGTMIELPRACVIADELAKICDFFSFGTNDLTQTTFGISRDDGGKFLPTYLEKNLLPFDPFQSLDVAGVGALIEWAVKKARRVNKKIEIGICGEHGGDPQSIEFFKSQNFDTISCSPYRVPVARLSAAQVVLKRKARKG